MKVTKRLVAMILVFMLLMANVDITALADAVLTMPDALQIIEEEAFYGSASIDKVVLSNKVTEIRSKAFANSSLSEINLPASIAYIAEDAFDGPEKVTVIATEGTYAYEWAVKHGYISEEIEAIDFSVSPDMLTLTVGNTYTLSATFVPSNATSVSITWSSSKKAVAEVNNGTITAKAEGTAIITAIAENGLTSTCEVTVVRSIPAPVINSAEQDGMGTVTLIWSSLGDDYEYLVYESVDSALVLLGSTTNNSFTAYAATVGLHKYCVQACIHNDNDILVSSEESALYDVDVQFIWTFGVSIEKIEQTSQDSAKITWRGVSPVSYYEIAEVKEHNYITIANNVTGDTITINGLTEGAHRYAIRSIHIDQNNKTWISGWSTVKAIEMLPEDDLAPVAPTLVFSEPTMAFSASESSAPEYRKGSIEVSWIKNESAQSYSLTIEKKTSSGYTSIIDESDIISTAYIISASIFTDITERTIYRFGIRSQGEISGEYVYSYFAVTVPDVSISTSSTRWERTSRFAGSRTFTVSSELSWVASSDSNWIKVFQYENNLEISLTENASGKVRTGTVTLNNGENSTSITVVQDRVLSAPVLSIFGQELSTDINNPTEIPAGGFSLGVEDNNANSVLMRFYQKSNESYDSWKQWLSTKESSVIYPYEWETITFSSGKEFCIEASGHYSDETNLYTDYESSDDAPVQKYYIKMVDNGHYVLINGQDSFEQTVYLETEVQLLTSNSWTATSDSSWLTFTNSKESDIRKQKLYISAEANYSGTGRTGHITISCGSTRAVITINQPDLTPRVISPTNLSQTESSPTSIGTETFAYTAIGSQMNWDYKSGSSWVNALYNDAYTWDEGVDESYIDSDIFESGKTYRLTISDATGRSSVYYLKRNSTSGKGIEFKTEHCPDNVKYYALNKPSGASTETVTLSASSSWSISSDSPWLTVSPNSGILGSDKVVTVSMTANTTTSERSGILSFKTLGAVCAKLKITQAAYGTDFVNVTVDNIPVEQANALDHVTGVGDSLDIRPYSPGGSNDYDEKIKAVSNASWISVNEEMFSGRTAGVKVAENTTGSRRNGTITFTYGSASKTITITQEPKVESITLSSPALSTSSTSPTVLTYSYGAVVLKWNKAANAVKYNVALRYVDSEDIESYYLYLDDTGSVNTATLQADWFDPAYTGKYRVRIVPVDAYGNTGTAKSWYFTRAVSNAVYINGKAAFSWNNVTDLGSTEEYSIASNSSWTASTNVSWISLGATSGSSGDKITVAVAANAGSARTGKVTIKSGSASAVLTVNQCAVLPEFPTLKAPAFSDDIANPTAWSKTNTLTVTWDVEPQANSYEVRLGSVTNASTTSVIEKSGTLKNKGDYTFNTSGLTEGQTYKITLIRSAENADGRVKSTGSSYYFTIIPAVPFLKVDDIDFASLSISDRTFEADGTEDHIRYTITSSGTWSATVSDPSWIMVAKTVKTAQYLAENAKKSSDYEQYVGNSGDSFYISLLENNTGNTRNGTVTITAAGISTTIIVTQEQYYVLPEISSPSLATRPSESVEIPFDNLALQWTAGEGNTGIYNIYLYEKNDGSYSRIYRKSNITTCSFAIPATELKENAHYRLLLETELESSGKTEGNYYYFHTGNANSLTVSASVDWSQVDKGGYVSITATAIGGAGGYSYAYQLLLNGTIEQQTTWETLKYYQFKPWSNGNYQVKVIVKDSANKQGTCTSDYIKDDENTISVATANHYTASLDSSYQFLDYSVLSQRSWSVTSYPDWITPSATSASFSGDIRLIITKNDGITRIGKVEFQSNTGIISDLTITQSGSRSVAMVVTEETFTNEPQTIDVSFVASDRWTASSDSSWVTIKTKSGTSGNRTITVSLSENTATTERTAIVSVISNGDVGHYTIHQIGKTIEQSGLKLSIVNWQVNSSFAETKSITITTNGNWSISSIPDWITADASSGTGVREITLYCSGNVMQDARNGNLTIICGGLSQSISITQPGNGIVASVINFSISKTSVNTGEDVSFTVKTKYADQVQLIVDDIAYDTYAVTNDQVTFTRAFSSAGTRTIKIMPIRLGKTGAFSIPQCLKVNSNGRTLGSPNIKPLTDVIVGQDVTISWDEVQNATTYTVYFSDGNSYFLYDQTETCKTLIEGKYLTDVGTYSIEIIASAPGYSQSSNGIDFTVSIPSVDFTVTNPKANDPFETKDLIEFKANNPSNYWLRFKVTCGDDTWYVPYDHAINGKSVLTQWTLPSEGGIYTVYAVGYANANTTIEDYWAASKKGVSFTVKSGTIEWLSIGGIGYGEIQKGSNSIEVNSLKNISLRTNMGVEKIDIYFDDVIVKTITKAEGIEDARNYRMNYSCVLQNVITEGTHKYQFIATDKDGKTYTTKKYTIYGYSGIDTKLTRYPATKTVNIFNTPTTQNGSTLNLSDEFTILGTFGDSLYYGYLNGDSSAAGYVKQNELVSEQVIDWENVFLNVMTWQKTSNPNNYYEQYVVSKPYNITLNWVLNTSLPSYYGFNLYLVSEINNPSYFQTVKLNNDITFGNAFIINSKKFESVYKVLTSEEVAVVRLKVDLVDSRTGEIMISALSSDCCTIFNSVESNKILDNVYTALTTISAPHDLVFKGTATVNGKTVTCRTIKEVTGIGKIYSTVTGDLKDVKLTPITQGVLLAESIMDQISRTKTESPIDISMIKTALSWIGFDLDIMEYLEKQDASVALDMLQGSKQLARRYDIDDSSLNEFYNKYFQKLKKISETQDVHSIVKNDVESGVKAANLVVNVLRDYFTFSSVKTSDVKIYIDLFSKSDNSALRYAADYLGEMTGGNMALFGYLLKAYGLNAAKDWVFEGVYKAAMSVLPAECKLAIKGATIVTNFTFNTNKVLEKGYELDILSEQCEEAKNLMISYYSTFKSDPAKYYDEMINRVEVFLSLMSLELKKFNEFASENEKGALAKLRNWIAGRDIPQYNVEAIMWVYEFIIESSLEQAYAVWVSPFK